MKQESYVVDTDCIIEYLQQKKYAITVFDQLIEKSSLYISTITLLELAAGWDTRQKTQYLPLILDIFEPKDVSRDIAVLSGSYRYDWKKKGKVLAPMDCLIAATAKQYKTPLITGNKKDYPMKDIVILSLTEVFR